MKIMYYPISNSLNKYIDISQNILKQLGCEIVPFTYKNVKTMMESDAVILNWYDSIRKQRNLFLMKNQIIKNKIKLMIIKKFGVKIVFTFHNRIPHNTDNQMKEKLLREYAKWICEKSDYIIILSKDSKKYLRDYIDGQELEKKVRYVPHPNYIGVYSPAIIENIYPEGDIFRVLFVGQVSKYKNVDLILDVAKELTGKNIHFYIAGKCSDDKYEAELIDRVRLLPNVDIDLKFINDDELEYLIREGHVLLLPYDMKSSMNSGTVMLAFSNGRTVICPEISTIKDFDSNDVYSYNYKSKDEHRKCISESLLKAYGQWVANKDDFESKGTRLLHEVKINNSPESLKTCYEKIITDIYKSKNHNESCFLNK